MKRWFVALLLVFALPAVSSGQEGITIRGLVTTAQDGLPLPGATVVAAPLGLRTVTGSDGRYEITVPAGAEPKTVKLTVSGPGVVTQTVTLTLSAGSVTHDVSLELGLSEEVTVAATTGSHIRRVDAETVLPVSVVDAEDVGVRAVATGAELFEQLPWFGRSLINERATGPNDARGDAASINLRGLGNNNTLVLLNGRRMAPHPVAEGDIPVTAANVNAIPLAATQQVEILRDGASAIYGSDAVAGVVNSILKKDHQGARVFARVGPYAGGTPEGQGSVLLGRNFNQNRSNVMLSYNIFHRDELPAADRSRAASSDKTGIVGGPQATARDSSGNLIWNFSSSQSAYGNFRAGAWNPTTRTFSTLSNTESARYPGIGAGGRFHVEPTASGTMLVPDAQRQQFFQDGQDGMILYPGTTRHNLILALNHQIRPRLSAFADFVYYGADSTFTNDASPSGQSGNNGIFIPRTNYYNPYGTRFYGPGTANPTLAALDIRMDNYRLVDNGQRVIRVDSDSVRALAGLRGLLGNWGWEGAVLYNVNKTIDNQDNRARESRLREALGRSTPDAWNPFAGPGQQRPETVAFVNYSTRNDGESGLYLADFRITGDLFKIGGGNVALAVGAEGRRESYQYIRDPLLKIPAGPEDPLAAYRPVNNTQTPLDDLIGISPSNDTDASREVFSTYAELAIPLVGSANARPGLRRLELSAAARFEHYSDFGGEIKPKFGLTWNPAERLLVRGSYAQGFLAPSLAQLGQADIFRTNTGRTDRYRFEVTGDTFQDGPAANTRELRAANPDLQPEESRSFSAGFVLEAPGVRDLTLSFDWFDVDTSDRIGRNGIQNLLDEDYQARLAGRAGSPSIVRRPFDAAELAVWNAYNAAHPGATRQPVGAVDYVRDDYFNIANRHVAGFDVSLHWRSAETGWGRFTLKTDGSFLRKFDDRDLPGDPVEHRVGEYDKPRHRLNGSVEWQRRNWSADVFVAHVPSVDAEDSSGDIGVDSRTMEWRIGSWTTFNASVGYSFSAGRLKNTRLRLGARNIFDTDPPLAPSADGFNSALHNARGRYVYAEIRTDF